MHPILNHLIAQNPDTRTALARHSGRRIALSATGLRLAGVITDEGYLAASGGEAEAVLRFHDSAIRKVLQGQTPGVGDIGVEGDHALGMALLPLLAGLHYHADQDIRRLFGEAAAERAPPPGSQSRRPRQGMREEWYAHVSDYVRHHDDTLAVHRRQFAEFAQAVETLRDDAARLEARLQRLASRN